MRRTYWFQGVLAALCVAVSASSLFAEYRETLTEDAPRVDLVTDYGLVSDDTIDQSDRLQKAIDELSAQGGGKLVLKKGRYAFADVVFKSNVHLFIEGGTVLKPYIAWDERRAVNMFHFGTDDIEVENVSLRGWNGRFTVEFRPHEPGLRVVSCKLVRNFLICNMNVQECWTKFCTIILGPPDTSPEKEGFFGATDGTIRDCSVFDASGGYGLAQVHAGKRILFENLYTRGGVAMRVETGVRPKNPKQIGGAFDLVGRNLKSENAGTCVLLSPHSTHNGVVKVDGVEAISCDFAVKIAPGFISKRKKREGPEPGTFAEGTTIKNVHAVFGTNTQRGWTSMKYVHPELLKYVRMSKEQPGKMRGASIAPVLYAGKYKVNIENVTGEGFEYVTKPVITEDDAVPKEVFRKLHREHLEKIGYYSQKAGESE
ncbi:MAG: Iota-carrageenase A2 [Planctomycetota bacterium]|nr:MAG: Iota-carrageenase A2 [Planctomycetota bacterium]